MHCLRIAVIGAGSTYTPELINGFIQRQDRLRIDSFAFCDTDEERCEILSSLTERMLRRAGITARVERYSDFRAAVRGLAEEGSFGGTGVRTLQEYHAMKRW